MSPAVPSLHISVQTDVEILRDFYCGQPDMDEFIHTRLDAFLKSYPRARMYVARDDHQQVVAMFVLSNGHQFLDEDCKEDLVMKYPDILSREDLKDYWESGAFPTIEIDYLAVAQNMRNCQIGTTLIHFISSLKDDDYFHDSKLISVSAYCTSEYSAVRFYQTCNFWAAEIKNPFADTLRMYRMFD